MSKERNGNNSITVPYKTDFRKDSSVERSLINSFKPVGHIKYQ